MKTTLLLAIVFSVVLANAENCTGFGYEPIMSVLNNVHKHTKSSERNLISVGTKIDHLMDEQRMELRSIETKLYQLIDVNVTGEHRCPENAADGEYNLKPVHSTIETFSVYCENGWIVIHRRFDGRLDFNRRLYDYRDGFGYVQGEHWLGLEKIHQITRVGSYELLVVLKDFDNVVKTAKYEGFRIGSEFEEYQLNLKEFVEGDAGDSLMLHNTMKFSTPEQKNDNGDPNKHCAFKLKSGWWFKNCYEANLNGFYQKGSQESMSWWGFNHNNYCLKEARMMIRAKKLNE